MLLIFRNGKNCFHVVILRDRNRARHAAFLAALDNAVLSRRTFESYGLHHPRAHIRSVAWLHIYMLTPQASGTVIGVAVTLHVLTAVLTGKIFNRPFETHIRLIAP